MTPLVNSTLQTIQTPEPPNQGSIVSGCFDPLHTGHQHILTEALRFGPVCIVIMSDDYIRSVKKRVPHQDLNTRLAILVGSVPNPSMFFVKVANSDEELQSICDRINPSHRLVGDDYKPEDVIKNEACTLIIVPRVGGYSSTSLRTQ